VNLQLGTRYFKTMVDKFGSFEYALAAYNAGSDRVEDWLSRASTGTAGIRRVDPVHRTREYVQAILRNQTSISSFTARRRDQSQVSSDQPESFFAGLLCT